MCERCRCFLIDSLEKEPHAGQLIHQYVRYKAVRRNAARIATLIFDLMKLVKPSELIQAKQINAWQAMFCMSTVTRSLHIYSNLVRFNPALKKELEYVHCEFIDMSLYKFQTKYTTEPGHIFMYESILPLVETLPVIHAEHSGMWQAVAPSVPPEEDDLYA